MEEEDLELAVHDSVLRGVATQVLAGLTTYTDALRDKYAR